MQESGFPSAIPYSLRKKDQLEWWLSLHFFEFSFYKWEEKSLLLSYLRTYLYTYLPIPSMKRCYQTLTVNFFKHPSTIAQILSDEKIMIFVKYL